MSSIFLRLIWMLLRLISKNKIAHISKLLEFLFCSVYNRSREIPTFYISERWYESMLTNAFMDSAKVMAKGQITIPKDVRDALGVSNGDRVTFIVEGNTVRIVNSAVYAMQVLQQEMAGEAERAGLTSEDTVVALVKEARKKQVQHLQRGEKQ